MKTKLSFIVYNRGKRSLQQGEGSSLLVENNFSINSQREN